MKIIACKIGPYPKSLLDTEMPQVNVTFEDGTQKMLFWFYPDEFSFSESEFIGKTEKEARKLRQQKDISYLRS